MSEAGSALGFKAMAAMFKLRDLLRPPAGKLAEPGLGPGMAVLDYGCGPGSFSVEAARITGSSGRVFALDISPQAIESVRRAAADAGLENVVPILSDCASGLDDSSIDVVLLYDIYHDLEDPGCVLDEIARVLKPEGIVSFSDHHMKEPDIIREMTGPGRFILSDRGKRTYSFIRQSANDDISAAKKG
jgi:ubiquinone/menaquinone biosynthesis C-methylase UbiE